MIRDITLGQYYPADSPLHRMDARVKILLTFAYIVMLFLVKGIPTMLLVAFLIFLLIKMSKVPFKFIFRGLKAIFFIITLTVVLNMFMLPGRTLVEFGIFKITYEGLYMAIFVGIRLVLLMFGSSLLTLTTKPLNLTDGIESILKPLEKIGVPAHELAMMMSIALRFIPTLLEETDKIMKAQMARGADFESGNIFKRAKAIIPLLVPLFVSAFRIARELAMAMEARCYRGGENRTRMNHSVISKIDYTAIIVFLAVSALILLQSYVLPLFFSYSIILNLG
ncbi:MAG: energy-coupling factor transporter transmembrane protein EcfT [Clostridiales bacterium]|nr:energy-coupling factor transporter transmembrane protein EcfT [Clostridiales bacterium]